MKVALVQTSLVWENPAVNRQLLQEKINNIDDSVDLIVLSEMFTTGFTMNPQGIAENFPGETLLWMQRLSAEKKTAITGSIAVQENGNFYNRLLFVKPDGSWQSYDKKHLFSLAGEDKVYRAGNKKLIVDYKGFRICLLICYDLRFPVYSRNNEDYDVLIYVANWPEVRTSAWDALLAARAIENQSYVVAVNRVGEDGNQHKYIGHSQVIDALGNHLLEPQELEDVYTVDLNLLQLQEIRQKFRFLADRDRFTFLE
ncbi:amidohydrolase [Flavobacterium sp. CYK-55]|uniref:amidohydrolase n=1 Tax=Flavobacterium sp. CYK-55 TaxID=2835529 RepID=UPI001BCE3F3A|nr:amidohydrolase [Flavobacterium sp. CYK-55]MBS7786030.1 amidohydrolase [Flavobacterium sp. CYK-55]